MTLFFYAHTTDLGVNTRLGTGWSVTESADNGTVAMSTFQLDDTDGSGSITTLNSFHIDETGCDPIRLYSGYFADLRLSRADSLLTGEARRWDCTVSDLNFIFNRYVLRGSDANRPSETDTARLSWLTGSSSFAIAVADNGLVTGQGITLDAADYRDRYPADVLTDCAEATNANWFAYFDDTTPNVGSLFYDLPSSTAFTSTLKISNVLADVDDSTTFAPSSDTALDRDPSRKASGIDLVWSNGRTYKTDSTLGFSRDLVINNQEIKTSSAAANVAAKLLAKAVDFDVITTTIQLPPDKVNLVLAGHRMQVKFSNLDGYESFTYLRVTRRTVAQAGETDQLYNVTLELSSPFLLGSSTGGGGSTPSNTGPQTYVPCGTSSAALVQYATNSNTPSGTNQVTLASAPTPGNLLVAVLMEQTVTAAYTIFATGFTTDYDHTGTEESGYRFSVLSRIVQSGDGETWTITYRNGTTNEGGALYLAEYSGVDTYDTNGPYTHIATTSSAEAGSVYVAGHTTNLIILAALSATGDLHTLTVTGATDNLGNLPLGPSAPTSVDFNLCDIIGATGGGVTYHPANVSPYQYAQASATVGYYCSAERPVAGMLVTQQYVATGDGSTTTFSLPNSAAFQPGSLHVFVDNTDQTGAVTSQDPAAGSFTLGFTPVTGEQVFASYIAA